MATKKTKDAEKFIGADILKSARWREFRDLLTMVLKDDEFYTADEVDGKLQELLNASVRKDINKGVE